MNELLSSLDRNILVWAIKPGGRLSPEWKEVLNKNIMNPLLFSGRGRIQCTSAQVEELTQFVEQKTITGGTQLTRETSNRRIQLQLKNNKKNIMEEKLKTDKKFSQYKNRFCLFSDLYKSK